MLLSMLGTVFHNNLENKENKSRVFSSCEKHGDPEKYLPTSGVPYLLHDGYKYWLFLKPIGQSASYNC